LADANAGQNGGSFSNIANPFEFNFNLAANEVRTYIIRSTLSGKATTEAAVIPLPAAAWLLLAGLGGLALVGRRRAA
jgi:hypothetical protein